MSARAAGAAAALGCLLACTEQTALTALPADVAWVVVVRGSPDGEEISPLLRVEGGALALALDADQTLELWGYGDELASLVYGVASTALASEPLRDAAPCESTLPAPRWSAHLSTDRVLSQVAPTRSWTAEWLNGQCPSVDPASLRTAADCALRSCGRVHLDGCRVELDLEDCGRAPIRGHLQARGGVCLIPPPAEGTAACTPGADTRDGLLAGLVCDPTGPDACTIELYDSPVRPVIDLDPITLADPAPEGVGPDQNDFGIASRMLRRMRAIPWGDGQLLVTFLPWGARVGCRDGDEPSITRWAIVDTHHLTVVETGTTTPCIHELARVSASEAVALAAVADDTWVLVRLDAHAREIQRYALTAETERHGAPQAMALTGDGELVVLYLAGEIADAFHTFVRHDPTTLAPVWSSAPKDGISTYLTVRGRTAWVGEASGRSIETMDLDTGERERPYLIPDLPREPLEVGGLILPDAERGTELIAILLNDVPGLLVTEFGTSRLRWYAPFHRDDAYPTALGMYRGEPVVTLISRDPSRRFRADLVSVDPVARRWKPGVTPLGLRVVSELVEDSHGRTWVIAPWDGLVARLP